MANTRVPSTSVVGALRAALTPFRFTYRWRDFVVFADDRPRAAVPRHVLVAALDEVLSNACRYSHPHGPVRVEVRQVDGRVLVAVSDEGEGLEPHDELEVFDEDLPREDEGREGLAATRAALEEYGAHIIATSRPGRGSLFTLDLPALVVLDEPRLDHPSHGQPEAGASGPGDDLADVVELFPND